MVTGLPEPAAACDSPVFVLCTGRSGSTLLRFLLDAHPDLACPPETRLPWLCTQLASAWSVIEDAPMPSGKAGLAPVPEPVIRGLRQSLAPMMTSYLGRRGKKRYCDKSLGAAQHAGLLRQAERLFEFVGVAPVPGITKQCFTAERQRFGPGDYKIWNTTGVTASSVGRGWQVPARLIPAELLAVVNDAAEQLGYVQIDETWGVGSPPADLRVPVPVDTSDPAPVPAGPVTAVPPTATSPDSGAAAQATASATALADGSTGQSGSVLAARVQAGLLSLGEEFTRSWKCCSAESVLLFATAPEPGGSAAWWRLDLGAGTATAGAGDRVLDTDWSVTGSADAWQRVLSGDLNLGAAFRGGELRYADKGDYGAGSAGADYRVAMIAELLGVTRWQPTDAERAPAWPASRLAS
jgi:hypothetical protein